MAGIGFRLQKILLKNTAASTFNAYLLAATISSGPWLLTVLCVGGLGILSRFMLEPGDHYVFRGIIVYTYAFSLIITGAFQMVITRYLADRFFSRDTDAVLPTYMIILLISTVLQTAAGGIFYSFFSFPLKLRITSTLLIVTVSNIWLAMVFLTALRNFRAVLVSFTSGTAVSFAGGALLGMRYGLQGLVGGFTAGQLLLLLLLSMNIFNEFSLRKSLNREFFYYFSRYPQLIFIGVLYNTAIWIDKFLFWFMPTGERIRDLLYHCPLYDTVMYLGFLSIVPSLSLFLIRIETSFYVFYRDFYGAITSRMPLEVIREKKRLLVESLYLSIQRLLKLQGLTSLVLILAAPLIIELLQLEWRQLALLRVAFLGTFLHALLLVLSIIILYFDFRNLCLGVIALFLATNTVFTLVSIGLGFSFYGYGYLASCFVTLITGFILFARKLNDLEYITFTQQPIISAKRFSSTEPES